MSQDPKHSAILKLLKLTNASVDFQFNESICNSKVYSVIIKIVNHIINYVQLIHYYTGRSNINDTF